LSCTEYPVTFCGGAEIRAPKNITIQAYTIIGNNVILDGRAGITIGSKVNLSSEVAIWTVQHDPQAADFGIKSGKVVVEDYAWLSFRSVVLPGVTIGEGAVVAACAVVTKDVEPYTIVAGIPAKKIGERNRDLNYTLAEGYIPFI
jgi:acetyltransferase-like isoleucine patch superfamily enzyme